MWELEKKFLTLLSNSEFPVVVEAWKSALRGKLVMRKGDNPDRG